MTRFFKEQEQLGIVERIEDVKSYLENYPNCSFLPQMGIFKMNRETTKVRIVYLSNLCERTKDKPNAVSHNNALLPGPCLNSKLATSLLQSRFGEYMLIFDITKAFLGIELIEDDQNKLLCLWYKNEKENDFSLIIYKNVRLSFGLRPSPTILTLALCKILILDIDNDDTETINLKKLIYKSIYIHNGIVTCHDQSVLKNYYQKIPSIFDDYQFKLQQFVTNDSVLQTIIDKDEDCCTGELVKFFGMVWDRVNDTMGPNPIRFNPKADTKRKSSRH